MRYGVASTPSPSWCSWRTVSSRRFAAWASEWLRGNLPDADLVFFFSTAELSGFIAEPSASAVAACPARGAAPGLSAAVRVSGNIRRPAAAAGTTASRHGRRCAAGSTGIARRGGRDCQGGAYAAGSRWLEPGEILVTPITDIGWTPYFSLIGGLVTDLGKLRIPRGCHSQRVRAALRGQYPTGNTFPANRQSGSP